MMNPIQLEITLTKQHWDRYYEFIHSEVSTQIDKSRRSGKATIRYFGMKVLQLCVVATILMTAFRYASPVDIKTAVVTVIAGLSVGAFYFFEHIRNESAKHRVIEPMNEGMFLGRRSVTISDEGVEISHKHFSSQFKWSAVRRVVKDENAIYIFYDTFCIDVLPIGELNNPDAVHEVLLQHADL